MLKTLSPLKLIKNIRQRLKTTEVNFQNRQIVRKLDPTIISPPKLKKLINSFPKKDREIVIEIIQRSTHSNVENLLADLETGAEHLELDNEFFMSLGSAGHALMYLIRKNRMRNSNYFCNYAELKQVKPDKIFLIDDICTRYLTEDELQTLSEIPKLAVINFNYFGLLPNFVDLSLPSLRVTKDKLQTILDSIKIRSSFSCREQALDKALNHFLDVNLEKLNARRSNNSLPETEVLSIPPQDKQPKNNPRESLQTVNDFLETFEPAQREAVRKYLAHTEGFQFYNPQKFAQGVVKVRKEINSKIKKGKINQENVCLVLNAAEQLGKSSDLLAYYFQTASGSLMPTITSQMFASFSPEQKRSLTLVTIDDILGSGLTTKAVLKGLVGAGQVYVGSIVSHQKGLEAVKAFFKENYSSNTQKGLLFFQAKIGTNLRNSNHPFFGSLTQQEQTHFRQAVNLSNTRNGPDEFSEETQGSEIFFFSVPDNANYLLQNLAKNYLNIPGRF